MAAGDPGAAADARYLYALMMMLRNTVPATGYPPTPFPYPYTQGLATGAPALTGTQCLELDTRRIAQWAINAVTFATNDSIMVPFKYDPYMFTNASGLPVASPGWHLIDDNITTSSSDATNGTPFGVVWGCKPPELLLTEAVAFHNRRVADTVWNNVSQAKNRTQGDKNGPAVPCLQQTRIPQGSLFVELYCPRPPGNQALAPDLYSFDSVNGWRLNLDAVAPAPPGGQSYPVWRIVVGQSAAPANASAALNNVRQRLATIPDSSAIEPEQYSADGSTNPLPTLAATGAFSLLRGRSPGPMR